MSSYYLVCIGVAVMLLGAMAEPEPTFSKPEIKVIHHHALSIPHFIHSRHIHVEPLILHPPHPHHEEIILAEPHHHDHHHHHEHLDVHEHSW